MIRSRQALYSESITAHFNRVSCSWLIICNPALPIDDSTTHFAMSVAIVLSVVLFYVQSIINHTLVSRKFRAVEFRGSWTESCICDPGAGPWTRPCFRHCLSSSSTRTLRNCASQLTRMALSMTAEYYFSFLMLDIRRNRFEGKFIYCCNLLYYFGINKIT